MAKIEGLDRLNRKLARLPVVAQKRIREAMEKGADEIVAMMKSLAPSDSGALVKSIGWTWGKAPKGDAVVANVTQTGTENTLTIYAGSAEAWYSRFVEFGTKSHIAGGKFAGATIPAIPASPFFYVSFRANKRRVKGRITRAINKAAKEVASGG